MSKIERIRERTAIYAYSQDDVNYLLGVIDRIKAIKDDYVQARYYKEDNSDWTYVYIPHIVAILEATE